MSDQGRIDDGFRAPDAPLSDSDREVIDRADQVISTLRRERAVNTWRDRIEEAFHATRGAA